MSQYAAYAILRVDGREHLRRKVGKVRYDAADARARAESDLRAKPENFFWKGCCHESWTVMDWET